MQTLSVVIASASGLVFGYATAAHFGSRAKDALRSSLTSDKEKALKKSKKEIATLKGKVENLDELSEQRKELEKKVKTAEAEAKTAQKQAKELGEANESLAKQHADELARVQEELEEARLAAGGDTTKLQAALDKAGKDLDPILKTLVDHEEQTAVLLADGNGIVIASAGDKDTVDGVAAAASILTGIPQQLNGVLPLDTNFSFHLQDEASAIVGRTFESSGELIGLTSIGKAAPSEQAITTTLASLNAALE